MSTISLTNVKNRVFEDLLSEYAETQEFRVFEMFRHAVKQIADGERDYFTVHHEDGFFYGYADYDSAGRIQSASIIENVGDQDLARYTATRAQFLARPAYQRRSRHIALVLGEAVS